MTMKQFGNNATIGTIISERRNDINVVNGLIRDTRQPKLYPQALITAATANIDPKATIVPVDSTANAVTLTLPAALSMQDRHLHVKDVGGNAAINNITIDAAGSETIDGMENHIINVNYENVQIWSNGEAWFII